MHQKEESEESFDRAEHSRMVESVAQDLVHEIKKALPKTNGNSSESVSVRPLSKAKKELLKELERQCRLATDERDFAAGLRKISGMECQEGQDLIDLLLEKHLQKFLEQDYKEPQKCRENIEYVQNLSEFGDVSFCVEKLQEKYNALVQEWIPKVSNLADNIRSAVTQKGKKSFQSFKHSVGLMRDLAKQNVPLAVDFCNSELPKLEKTKYAAYYSEIRTRYTEATLKPNKEATVSLLRDVVCDIRELAAAGYQPGADFLKGALAEKCYYEGVEASRRKEYLLASRFFLLCPEYRNGKEMAADCLKAMAKRATLRVVAVVAGICALLTVIVMLACYVLFYKQDQLKHEFDQAIASEDIELAMEKLSDFQYWAGENDPRVDAMNDALLALYIQNLKETLAGEIANRNFQSMRVHIYELESYHREEDRKDIQKLREKGLDMMVERLNEIAPQAIADANFYSKVKEYLRVDNNLKVSLLYFSNVMGRIKKELENYGLMSLKVYNQSFMKTEWLTGEEKHLIEDCHDTMLLALKRYCDYYDKFRDFSEKNGEFKSKYYRKAPIDDLLKRDDLEETIRLIEEKIGTIGDSEVKSYIATARVKHKKGDMETVIQKLGEENRKKTSEFYTLIAYILEYDRVQEDALNYLRQTDLDILMPIQVITLKDWNENLEAFQEVKYQIMLDSIVLKGLSVGEFNMGSPQTEENRGADEELHKVKLTQPFWIATMETTWIQWQVEEESSSKGLRNVSHFLHAKANTATNYEKFDPNARKIGLGNGILDDWNLPVNGVNWEEAMGFCFALNAEQHLDFVPGYKYSLPTEAQWEYACRAGSDGAFADFEGKEENFILNEDTMDVKITLNGSNDLRRPMPLYHSERDYRLVPNAWGLYNMHGNVAEWCLDFYASDLTKLEKEDPQGPSKGSEHVIRGGSFMDPMPLCRSASRRHAKESKLDAKVGFRIAYVPDGTWIKRQFTSFEKPTVAKSNLRLVVWLIFGFLCAALLGFMGFVGYQSMQVTTKKNSQANF